VGVGDDATYCDNTIVIFLIAIVHFFLLMDKNAILCIFYALNPEKDYVLFPYIECRFFFDFICLIYFIVIYLHAL
jgi:hypothetical protein